MAYVSVYCNYYKMKMKFEWLNFRFEMYKWECFMKNIKNSITKEQIYRDPFGYTYKEMVSALGETDAKILSSELYSKRKNNNSYFTIRIKDVFDGKDTTKYAFELSDNFCIETVCIKRKTGTTICISTMVGCPVGCIFCASGKNGFIRNLTPSEIVQQVVMVKERINRIVFMGMGEPLFNYDSVIKSIHILRDRDGLNFPTDGITISTVGPVPQLKKLREEHLKIQLTLSLHATNQRTRNLVMPHMKIFDIEEIVESVLSYSDRHNRKVTIAYLLIPGVNDKPSDVHQLSKWFAGKNVLINVLQYNETECSVVKRPNKQQLVAFKKKLEDAGLSVKLRESRGNNIKAACGQLVSNFNKKNQGGKRKDVVIHEDNSKDKKKVREDNDKSNGYKEKHNKRKVVNRKKK